jgi:hypothetical protein
LNLDSNELQPVIVADQRRKAHNEPPSHAPRKNLHVRFTSVSDRAP